MGNLGTSLSLALGALLLAPRSVASAAIRLLGRLIFAPVFLTAMQECSTPIAWNYASPFKS